MVHHITNVIKEYQDILREMPYVPKSPYRRDSLGYSGDANKNFLAFLFSDQPTGIQFLKDVGLIRNKVQCNFCGRDMISYADPNVLHGFRSRCPRMVAGTMCSGCRSIRHARAVNRHSATSVTFAALPPNIADITLSRTTAVLAAIFGPRLCSRFLVKNEINVICVSTIQY
jgi:hypothetical protein